jgi:glycosyltransferase involved in cell wall biosynthesis
VRICLIYDCLYPHTVGGAERWYRDIAERLVADGHDVTYVTLRQWERGERPQISEQVKVVEAGPRMELYVEGRRRILPPLRFGAGVLWHLLRHGRGYDAVHTASFPYFSLLAAGLLRRAGGYELIVDWHEVWSRTYWRDYLGGLGGLVGWIVQRLAMRPRQHAFTPSRLHAERLRDEGFRYQVDVLDGRFEGPEEPLEPLPAEPLVAAAGRHIPEKRMEAIVPAVLRAREQVPELRGEIVGDGPARGRVLDAIERGGANGAVTAPGFVSGEHVEHLFRRALCMVLASEREGYGMVVVEASSHGTPTVVARAPDNAAVELVEDGVNGVIADSSSPEDLAAAILRVHAGGQAMRESTADWYRRNAHRLALTTSLDTVSQTYAGN